MTASEATAALKEYADPVRAKHDLRFFKTGHGEYGEGDRFWGIVVPNVRKVSRIYKSLELEEVSKLIDSSIHEVRQCGLFILVLKFENTKELIIKKSIYDLYMRKAKQGRVNNWDLVDLSAPRIVGGYLFDKNRSELLILANSGDLWLQRIAVLASSYFINQREFYVTLKLAEQLLDHPHDLIHKAVGWMLREVGKQDKRVETDFLDKHYRSMPRTMLRYVIEKLPKTARLHYLRG